MTRASLFQQKFSTSRAMGKGKAQPALGFAADGYVSRRASDRIDWPATFLACNFT